MSKSNNNSTGIGFFGMLGILFIGLKLTNFIAWSWWWVTAPLWGPLSVLIVVVALLFVASLFVD